MQKDARIKRKKCGREEEGNEEYIQFQLYEVSRFYLDL
jgi:hypothetical protein